MRNGTSPDSFEWTFKWELIATLVIVHREDVLGIFCHSFLKRAPDNNMFCPRIWQNMFFHFAVKYKRFSSLRWIKRLVITAKFVLDFCESKNVLILISAKSCLGWGFAVFNFPECSAEQWVSPFKRINKILKTFSAQLESAFQICPTKTIINTMWFVKLL